VLAIQQTIEAIEMIDQGIRETALGMSQTRGGTEQLNRTAQELEAKF
jgi:methyl-accepting chemotaxis protein